MPLVLKEAQNITIDTVRITSFTATAARSVSVSYERGYTLGDKFVPLEAATAEFSAGDVASADAGGNAYGAVKAVLYALLQGRVGPGSVK